MPAGALLLGGGGCGGVTPTLSKADIFGIKFDVRLNREVSALERVLS